MSYLNSFWGKTNIFGTVKFHINFLLFLNFFLSEAQRENRRRCKKKMKQKEKEEVKSKMKLEEETFKGESRDVYKIKSYTTQEDIG